MYMVSPALPGILEACGPTLWNPRLVVKAIELAVGVSGWPKYEIETYEELLSRIKVSLSPQAKLKLKALRSLDVSIVPLTQWHAFEAVSTTLIDGSSCTEDVSVPTVMELMLTLDILQGVIPLYEMDRMLSDEVKRYIGRVWNYHGYLYFPEDYEFLNGYVMCGMGKPQMTEEQLGAYKFWLEMRRVAEQIPLVEAYRDTVSGVAAMRMYCLKYGREIFAEKGYVTPEILYENAGPTAEELEKITPRRMGLLLKNRNSTFTRPKVEPTVSYSEDEGIYDSAAYRGPVPGEEEEETPAE